MNIKKINDINDIKGPLFFLVFGAVLFGTNLGFLEENLRQCGSVILGSHPFRESNFFLTATNIIFLFLPLVIFLTTFFQNSILLRFAYFFIAVGFTLNPKLINWFGYESLYAVQLIALFIASSLLIKYIVNKIDNYKTAAHAGNKTTDNQSAAQDAQKPARP